MAFIGTGIWARRLILYPSNVLIGRTIERVFYFTFSASERLSDTTHGVKITIVDYSLSRITKGGSFINYLHWSKVLVSPTKERVFKRESDIKIPDGSQWRTFFINTTSFIELRMPFVKSLWLNFLFNLCVWWFVWVCYLFSLYVYVCCDKLSASTNIINSTI